MNAKPIFWIAGILGLVIVIGIVWYFLSAPNATAQPQQSSAVTLPVSGTVSPSPSSSSQGKTQASVQSVTAQDGTAIVTKDFIHDGVTIPDTANTGRYLLAGNLGYCPSNPQQCQAAGASNFNVYYDGSHQSFSIGLTKEPIGQARLDMEQFMFATLGITQQQMCSLNYYVGTTYQINALYDDRNLGFSFCPGATTLPK